MYEGECLASKKSEAISGMSIVTAHKAYQVEKESCQAIAFSGFQESTVDKSLVTSVLILPKTVGLRTSQRRPTIIFIHSDDGSAVYAKH